MPVELMMMVPRKEFDSNKDLVQGKLHTLQGEQAEVVGSERLPGTWEHREGLLGCSGQGWELGQCSCGSLPARGVPASWDSAAAAEASSVSQSQREGFRVSCKETQIWV